MGILLVRHSDAVEGGGNIDDAARWLSQSGRARAQQSARNLAAKGLVIERFVTSPRVRAVQTAELFAAVLGFRGAIEVVPELSYTVPAREAVRALTKLSGTVAAFGHMPTIAEIVQLLTQADRGQAVNTSEAVYIEQGRAQFRVTAEG